MLEGRILGGSMKDSLINIAISVGLTLLAGRIKKLKGNKVRQLVVIWSGFGDKVREAALDDDVSLEEAVILRFKIERAIQATKKILLGGE